MSSPLTPLPPEVPHRVPSLSELNALQVLLLVEQLQTRKSPDQLDYDAEVVSDLLFGKRQLLYQALKDAESLEEHLSDATRARRTGRNQVSKDDESEDIYEAYQELASEVEDLEGQEQVLHQLVGVIQELLDFVHMTLKQYTAQELLDEEVPGCHHTPTDVHQACRDLESGALFQPRPVA